MTFITDPYHELRRDGQTFVGPVVIKIHHRTDGKYIFCVKLGTDALGDKRAFKFDWEAQDAATQAIRYAEDIRSGKSFKSYMIDAAARSKGFRKRMLLWFVKHFDEIKE